MPLTSDTCCLRTRAISTREMHRVTEKKHQIFHLGRDRTTFFPDNATYSISRGLRLYPFQRPAPIILSTPLAKVPSALFLSDDCTTVVYRLRIT